MKTSDVRGEPLLYIDPALIEANPDQPRRIFEEEGLDALADSVRQYGILQPLSVRRAGEGAAPRYQLIMGERRLRAAVMVGLDKVPCRVLSVSRERGAELAVVENLQREDLTVFEEADAISRLLSLYGMTQESLAERLSVSQSYIANKLRLLGLEEDVREKILVHGLTERHARALLRLKTAEKRREALSHIVKYGCNVAAAERYIDAMLEGEKTPPKRRHIRGAIKDLKLFYNSLDRALDIMKGAGVETKLKKREVEGGVEVTILLTKAPS